MKIISQLVFATMAAALMTFSIGCQPPKPPAPEPAPAAEETEAEEPPPAPVANDNMTGNTTAGSETPVAETP